MMQNVHLSPEIESRLSVISQEVGLEKDELIVEAILKEMGMLTLSLIILVSKLSMAIKATTILKQLVLKMLSSLVMLAMILL